VLCFAPTRSGKGVGLVVPSLLTWPGSAIVHDIKGENWTLTAGLIPQRHPDAIHSQVRRYRAGLPQKRPNGPWPNLLERMRRATQPIWTIGKFANNITDLIRAASRHQLLFAAGTVLAGVATCFAWYWVTIGRYIESTDDAYVGGEVTTLSFKVAGLIKTVAIVDNQAVKAGGLLLKLDDRDYSAQLARAEANIAARRAALVNVDATRRMRVSMLEQARADLAAAMAERVRAKYDIDRYRSLNNAQFASRQRFEQADADNEKARAAERKAQAAPAVSTMPRRRSVKSRSRSSRLLRACFGSLVLFGMVHMVPQLSNAASRNSGVGMSRRNGSDHAAAVSRGAAAA
jgi:hypothetical protein